MIPQSWFSLLYILLLVVVFWCFILFGWFQLRWEPYCEVRGPKYVRLDHISWQWACSLRHRWFSPRRGPNSPPRAFSQPAFASSLIWTLWAMSGWISGWFRWFSRSIRSILSLVWTFSTVWSRRLVCALFALLLSWSQRRRENKNLLLLFNFNLIWFKNQI